MYLQFKKVTIDINDSTSTININDKRDILKNDLNDASSYHLQ